MYEKGDLVECTNSYVGQFTKGNIYEIKHPYDSEGLDFWGGILNYYLYVTEDDSGRVTNGWTPGYFKLHKRKENMSKTDSSNKYKKLLAHSEGHDSKFKNIVFVNDGAKAVIATNGARLLADRTNYEETKVLSRVLDSNGCLECKEGVFVATQREKPDFDSIMPTQKKLDSSDYKKIRLVIPKWLGSIGANAVKPYISLVLGDTPVLAIGDSYENAVGMNAHFLKPFSGEAVDIYLKTDIHSAVVILPSGGNVESVDWFAMIMPVKKDKKAAPQYFKPGDEVDQK